MSAMLSLTNVTILNPVRGYQGPDSFLLAIRDSACIVKRTLLSGQNLAAGTVLGKVTSSGKYARLDLAAVDGRDAVAGILAVDVDASGGDAECLVVVADAEVDAADLVWPEGIATDDQRAAVYVCAKHGIFLWPNAPFAPGETDDLNIRE